MSNILPPRTIHQYPGYGDDTIYGRYRFEKDDAFLIELQKHYSHPNIRWESFESWFAWNASHEAWTISLFDKYKLSPEFDTNSLEVQSKEVYGLIRSHIDSFNYPNNGIVTFWFVGFDIKPLIMVYENHHQLQPTLQITLAVAYYPDPE